MLGKSAGLEKSLDYYSDWLMGNRTGDIVAMRNLAKQGKGSALGNGNQPHSFHTFADNRSIERGA